MSFYIFQSSLTPREVYLLAWLILATTTVLTTIAFVAIFLWRRRRPSLPNRVLTSLAMVATTVASLSAIQAAITSVFFNRPDPVFLHLDLLLQLLPTMFAAGTVFLLSRFGSRSRTEMPPPTT